MREMLDEFPCINSVLYCAGQGLPTKVWSYDDLCITACGTRGNTIPGLLEKRHTRSMETAVRLSAILRYFAHHVANLTAQVMMHGKDAQYPWRQVQRWASCSICMDTECRRSIGK